MYLKIKSTTTYFSCLPAFLLALLPAKSNCQSEIRADSRPNILFIMADDHDIQAISSYGSKLINTPGIDRLAREGVRFTNCFNVISLCAPSRAALITGKYNRLNGVLRIGDPLEEKQETFPKLLQHSGYRTALIGKWHLLTEPQGFDYYSVLPGQGIYFNCPMKVKGQPWGNGNQGGIPTKGYITDVITDQAIDWLKQNSSGNPFLLMIHHKAPHSPHEYPEKYAKLFENDLPFPETFNDNYSGKNPGLLVSNAGYSRLDHIYPNHFTEKVPEGMDSETYKKWAYQSFFKGYLRLVASLDENISRLLRYLDESGLAKKTIVVYTSDNGFFLGEHGLFNKMWMYEESMRLPLIVRFPGVVKPGSVNNEMVSILDIAPTFVDFAHEQIPSTFQGKSIRPLIEGEKPKNWRETIYYHYFTQYEVPEHDGIRTKKYKLIRFYILNGNSFNEMYHLSNDPGELNNLYLNPKYKSVKNRLENSLNEMKTTFETEPGTKY